MWKPEHRRAVMRRGLRHESDLTDAEWALVSTDEPQTVRAMVAAACRVVVMN